MNKNTKKPKKLVLVIIDRTTGTVLSPDNLYAVLCSENQAEWASNSDSDAFDLAEIQGNFISPELLHAVAAPELHAQIVRDVAFSFGFSVEKDNDGQLVLYTGITEPKKKGKK